MAGEMFGITREKATKVFGEQHDTYPSDKDAEEGLAKLTGATERIIENQNKRRLAGRTISGELYPRMCCLIAMSEAFGLKIDESLISQPVSALLEEHREKVEEELENNLREREQAQAEDRAELGRKEEALAEETERSRAEMRQRESALQEDRDDLERRESQFAEEKRQFRAREAEVKAIDADVKRRQERISKWTILRNEFSAGGLLEPKPGKSLALAQAEVEERYQNERCSQDNGYAHYEHRDRAKRIRTAIEKEEWTFNIVTAPLRAVIHRIVELA